MLTTVQYKPEEIEIPMSQIKRYLGIRENVEKGKSDFVIHTDEMDARIATCLSAFKEYVSYQACYTEIAVKKSSDGELDLGFAKTMSQQFAQNIDGCERAVVFACTIGMETERQKKKAGLFGEADAVILDAIGTSAVEALAIRLSKDLSKAYEELEGMRLRPRFSPGYGDLELSLQKPLLSYLNASSLIGITLSDSYLMMPQKSVTAMAGIGKEGCEGTEGDCELCSKKNCEFRQS